MVEEEATNTDRRTNWGKFGTAVFMAALKATAIGLVGGGFLFYSYASPMTNMYNVDLPNPLLNVNVIAMLCGGKEDLKCSEQTCQVDVECQRPSTQGGGNQNQSGGLQATKYPCPTPTSQEVASEGSVRECEFPYTWYQGKKTVELMNDYSDELGAKIIGDPVETFNATWEGTSGISGFFRKIGAIFLFPFHFLFRLLVWMRFWTPIIGHNGKLPKDSENYASADNRGGAVGIWAARSTALTWSRYRYLLAMIFSCSPTIKPDASPVFKIQFFAYLYALVLSAVAETIVPALLPIIAAFNMLFGNADACVNEAVPGLPMVTNLFYCIIMCWAAGPFMAFMAVAGVFYFLYLITLGPIMKDKRLYFATLQCNQKFIGLLFATFVAFEASTSLDETTAIALQSAYAMLFLYYLYQNKDWFKAMLQG